MKRVASLMTLATVLVLSACESPTAFDSATSPSFAATPAFTLTDNIRFPIDIVVFVPCAAGGAGEDVLLSGTLHSLFHVTVNDNNFTVKFHNQPQGVTGSGLTTGDKYQGTGVTQGTFGGSFMNGQFSDTFVNNFRIIGQGRGNNLLVHQTFHITINANGVLTAFVDNFRFDCR